VKEHEALKGSKIQVFYPDDFLEDTMNVSKVVAVTLDNKVLLLKRTDTGEFDIPGGHGKDGETAAYTAIRETQEETGLELFNLNEISTKQVTFQGRDEQITYFYAKLNEMSEVLKNEINLDTNENSEFYFVDPQFIDDFMGNATQNLKNMGNSIKSLTMDEQMEPFQKKMAQGYSKKKKIMIGLGKNKYKSAPYNRDPSYERAKSAPPGFGGSLEESMNNLLAEIEFDLSKLVMKDTLCPGIWVGEKIVPEIRKKLLQIADDFVEDTPIEGRIEDITFTGSLAGYNYYDGSDIDLHILVDFDENDELVRQLMNALRINWNNSHDIFVEGHEVEIYVQDANEKHYSSGVFSLKNDKWLQKPVRDEVEIDKNAVVKKAEALSDEIDAIQDDYDAERYEEVQNTARRLREKLKKMRSTGLEEEGIYSVENLAFKLLRNSGQIGKLMSFQSDSYDKSLGYGQKNKIRVNIVRNMSEKKKKPKFHGVYYPAGGLQDSFGAPSDGDGSGE
jgi:8-oxo-dGTP pyrophosphatase MutT (NUDIX family)